MKKLLIVDGHNLLFQMFFGMPNKFTNKDGKYIHGIVGFVGALIKIIQIVSPTNVIVVFDGEIKNERLELNKDYKANRPDYSKVCEEDNPFSQLEDIYKCLKHMKIPFLEATEFEADDIIAAYALRFQDNYEVIISSYDSDFFQLINDFVKVLRYKGDHSILIDANYLLQKYEIKPLQYAFYKSLVGDTADNIKGVTRIGKITASKIVNAFHDIDYLYENIEKIDNQKLIAILKQEKDKLFNNYEIIHLTPKASLPYSIEELKFTLDDKHKTNIILQELGLR